MSQIEEQQQITPSMIGQTSHMFNTQMIQLQMINRMGNILNSIQTGDETIDFMAKIVLQSLIISVISSIFLQLNHILNWIKDVIYFAYSYLCRGLKFVCNKSYYFVFKRYRKIWKTVSIPMVSKNKEMNELYKAVNWYLKCKNKTDYIAEDHCEYVYSKKIDSFTTINSDFEINKSLLNGKTKRLKFKNHEIQYYDITEMITIYTDREKRKENFVINIQAYVNEYDKTDILEEFCQFCVTEYVASLSAKKWVQMVFTHKDGRWLESPSNNSRKLETVILKEDQREFIKKDIDLFLNSEEWYKERDIPYKRGYLLYGSPGTGKTSIIKAISNYTKRHMHYLMLNEIKSNSELMELLKLIDYEKTILVIEDIDAMGDFVKSRADVKNTEKSKERKKKGLVDNDNDENLGGESQNHKKNCELTLSGLLNALDGIFTTHGRILIMTTNHREFLDDALIRPGRCDHKLLFSNCDQNQIREIYRLYFETDPEDAILSKIENLKYSPAQVTTTFQIYRNNPENAMKNLLLVSA